MIPKLSYSDDASFIIEGNRYKVCDFFVEDFVATDDHSGLNPLVIDSIDLGKKEAFHYIFKDYEPDWHFENFGQFDKTRANFELRHKVEVEAWENGGPRLYVLPYESIRVRLFATVDPSINILIDENQEIVSHNLPI